MAPPPALADELVEEVLLRIPPEDPAGLVRSALVCKPWFRVVSDPGFRRRIRELHRAAPPPVLGILCNPFDADGDVPFVPASSFRPARARGWRALDARHGRVLFCNLAWEEEPVPGALVVWDPVTGERTELPELPRHDELFEWFNWNAAVLCAADTGSAGACDRLDCHRGPFLVVIVGTTIEGAFAHVYSSEDGDWMLPTSGARIKLDLLAPSVLVGNALYFKCEMSTGILRYDLSTRKLSVIYSPLWHGYAQPTVLMTAEENGELGFATVYDNKLYLWAREAASDGAAGWAQSRVIELNTLLPADVLSTSPTVVGFADCIEVFFLETLNGLFSIKTKVPPGQKGAVWQWHPQRCSFHELLHSSTGSWCFK